MGSYEQGLETGFDLKPGASSCDVSSQSMSSVSRPSVPVRAFETLTTAAEVTADFFTCVMAVFLAYSAYFALSIGRHLYYPHRDLAIISCMIGFLAVFLFDRESAYRGGSSLMRIRETERCVRISCAALILFLPLTWVVGRSYSRGMILFLVPILPGLLLLQKYIFFSVMQRVYAKGYGVRKVLIYGAKFTGRRLFSVLLQSPKLGYDPIAVVDPNPALQGTQIFELGYNRRRSVQVSAEPVTAEYLRLIGCNSVFIAIPGLPREEVFRLSQAASAAGVEVAFPPDHHHLNAHASDPVDFDGLLLTFASEQMSSWSYRASKFALDLVVSASLLIALSPLLLVIAVVIRWDSEGPALFWQKRIGMNGRPFMICKFRTMHVNAPIYAKSPVFSEDRRITRAGRILRKTSLDELPQLINVLRREMSLVGPRPEMPFIVEKYDDIQRQRLRVIPGITGLWQISADRAFLIHENPEYDHYYIRHRGFFLDLAILLHTALFAMRGV